MKFLSALLSFIILAASVLFALSNRQSVTVSLWPFDVEIIASLYVMVLGALALGLVAGGFIMWLGALRHRFAARRLGKDVVLLSDRLMHAERELEQHRARLGETDKPQITGSKWRFWERF